MVANNGNGNSNRVTVSVRSLINNRSLTKPQRAFIGKRVKHGEIELELTDKLIALAVGCSVGYLHAAEKCSEGAEELINARYRPLILQPIRTTVNGKPAPVVPETDDQLVEIAHRVGVERMWDAIQRAMT